MIRIGFLLFSLLLSIPVFAQVTSNPAIPTDTKTITITFDATQGTAGLKDFTGDVYAHTGVITNKSTSSSDWKYVIAPWATNLPKAKLIRVSTNIYTFEISPDIRSFYGVPTGETIKQLAFVFRSSDGLKEGKALGGNDILMTVYSDGLNISISSPTQINIFGKNEPFTFTASTSTNADLKIYNNNNQIASQPGNSISTSVTIPDAGNYWLKVTATANNTTVRDSVYVCIRENTITESRPPNILSGINYINDQTVILSIYAPYKNNIFVVGDFNEWRPDNNYQMKKDGDYFWVTLNNLSLRKEYIFQYLIDGNLQIADAYTDKVSDSEDKNIPSSVYPNLPGYPAGKAVDRASVLQTGQTPFQWSIPTYTVPEASKLSIYELLIRDFTTEKTYKAVQEKLDYLKKLGINTIELMPFSEFEGNSSWGYNPNFYFAPDKAYGTKDNLKSLIDECHKQGFIVIQDMVMNHSYGSNPMVKMYWNNTLNRPAANNPWFNETSPNPVYSWGSDFNHESPATQEFVDRVTKYWLTEYKVDGFRFDFTKGFTNTPGDGSGYDASRIAILERMADKIWEVNPKAYVILEHFAANNEEQVLSSYHNGMLIWGNENYNFCEAAMGYNESGKSDFSWASYQKRGYSKPGLVAYMESHDEERQLFKTITYGNSLGDYNTKNLTNALERSQLATTFFMSLAGPKMIWQFGELGYDISIDQGGRISEKPVHWEYLDDQERMKLFNVYSAMLRLRERYDVFSSGKETLSLTTELKKIQLILNNHNINLIGNFGVAEQSIIPAFQHTGTWYEFFSGNELRVSDINTPILLKPGEYQLYSDLKIPSFKEILNDSISSSLNIFPNPVQDELFIKSPEIILRADFFSLDGSLIKQINLNIENISLPTSFLKPGIYILRLQTKNRLVSKKLIKL